MLLHPILHQIFFQILRSAHFTTFLGYPQNTPVPELAEGCVCVMYQNVDNSIDNSEDLVSKYTTGYTFTLSV